VPSGWIILARFSGRPGMDRLGATLTRPPLAAGVPSHRHWGGFDTSAPDNIRRLEALTLRYHSLPIDGLDRGIEQDFHGHPLERATGEIGKLLGEACEYARSSLYQENVCRVRVDVAGRRTKVAPRPSPCPIPPGRFSRTAGT
jgi:hypothetical protein